MSAESYLQGLAMFVQLPVPYHDEVLYSVIARYISHLELQPCPVTRALFGRMIKAQIRFPGGLGALAARTYFSWGRTANEIANDLTLFPYFARYLEPERADRCLELMKGDCCTVVHARIGASSRTVDSPRNLLFCEQCRDEDISLYGETYWRRAHLLPGALVCTKHEQVLLNSSVSPRDRAWLYFDATACAQESCTPVISKADIDTSMALAVSRRSQELLYGFPLDWPAANVIGSYRLAAARCGFARRLRVLSLPDIAAAFHAFYGESYLTLLGCQLSGNGHWLRKMLEPSRPVIWHPLRHVLLQLFFESYANGSVLALERTSESWRCPNPYFQHEQPFPITPYLLKTRKNGLRALSARCPCGMRFTFSRVCISDPRLPIIDSVRDFAPSWAAKLKDMRASGLGRRKIASQMRLPYASIVKLVSEIEPIVELEQRRALLRAEWLECLSKVPEANRRLARLANKGLYEKLATLDPDWLSMTGTTRTKLRGLSTEDWGIRDNQWAERLEKAADKLWQLGSVQRITRTKLILEADLKLWTLSKLKHLPRCRLVLANRVGKCSRNFPSRARII
ncbi:TnsD family Tn7-like transposition protein [Microvirga sp. M2]|uniref:TnsD family Tn7-like transposition protein n=1 Tax=Microvirga sp. M2 TaxID=3073270 RepID=UPI0039C1D1F4